MGPGLEASGYVKSIPLAKTSVYRLTRKIVCIGLIRVIIPGLPPYPSGMHDDKFLQLHHIRTCGRVSYMSRIHSRTAGAVF